MPRQSLLWKITNRQGINSYMFGTMHVRDDRVYQLCEVLYPLIRNSEVFIGEMDLNEVQSERQLPRYNIADYMRKKDYDKARRQFLKSFQLDLDDLKQMHPLMILSVLSTSVLAREHLISLDEYLWNYAVSQNREVSGLESFEKQLQLLTSIEPDTLYKEIKSLSANPAKIRVNTQKSLSLYLKGKTHQLYILSKASVGRLRKKMIYERNLEMAHVIDHLDVSKQYFITVGAGHISGQAGLVALLKKSGWTVKPVSLKC
jgi:uncharacterized protein YbaP (TraB family)